MSFNVSALSTYTKQVGELFAAQIIPENLFGNVKIMDNVKYKTNINTFASNLYLQADACDLAVSGNTAFDAVLMEVCPLTSHDKFCMKTLDPYWMNELMKPGSNITDLDFFAKDYLPHLADLIEKEVQEIFWRGNEDSGTGNLGLCSGILYRLSGTTTVNTGLTTPSVATLAATINEMILAVPAAIAGNKLNIFLSDQLYNMWIQSYPATYGASPYYLSNDDKTHPFHRNFTFVPQSGLADTNYIVIADGLNNLVYGTDIKDEISLISVNYDFITKNVYVDVSWKQGAQVIFPQEVVKNFVAFP